MPIAMKLLEFANGKSLLCAGEYVRTVDVQSAPLTSEWLTTTPNIREAYLWQTKREALETYYEILLSDPVRSDGEPNCPLTALNVDLVPVKKHKLT